MFVIKLSLNHPESVASRAYSTMGETSFLSLVYAIATVLMLFSRDLYCSSSFGTVPSSFSAKASFSILFGVEEYSRINCSALSMTAFMEALSSSA